MVQRKMYVLWLLYSQKEIVLLPLNECTAPIECTFLPGYEYLFNLRCVVTEGEGIV